LLLGLSAAFSHSLVIWALAAVALALWPELERETTEPYFKMVSGLLVIGMADGCFGAPAADQRASAAHDHADEGPQGGKLIDTGHGLVEITRFRDECAAAFPSLLLWQRPQGKDFAPTK